MQLLHARGFRRWRLANRKALISTCSWNFCPCLLCISYPTSGLDPITWASSSTSSINSSVCIVLKQIPTVLGHSEMLVFRTYNGEVTLRYGAPLVLRHTCADTGSKDSHREGVLTVMDCTRCAVTCAYRHASEGFANVQHIRSGADCGLA